MKKIKGFTLIELLIVVAIIGIIAAIAIPNLLDAIERSRQKKSVSEVQSIAQALQSFSTDYGGYPPTSVVPAGSDPNAVLDNTVYADLAGSPAFEPDYIQAIPTADGWGVPYQLTVGPDGAQNNLQLGTPVAAHFCLAGLGSDMADGQTNANMGEAAFSVISGSWCANPPVAAGTLETHCYESDIVWGDSSFLQRPEGKQKHC